MLETHKFLTVESSSDNIKSFKFEIMPNEIRSQLSMFFTANPVGDYVTHTKPNKVDVIVTNTRTKESIKTKFNRESIPTDSSYMFDAKVNIPTTDWRLYDEFLVEIKATSYTNILMNKPATDNKDLLQGFMSKIVDWGNFVFGDYNNLNLESIANINGYPKISSNVPYAFLNYYSNSLNTWVNGLFRLPNINDMIGDINGMFMVDNPEYYFWYNGLDWTNNIKHHFIRNGSKFNDISDLFNGRNSDLINNSSALIGIEFKPTKADRFLANGSYMYDIPLMDLSRCTSLDGFLMNNTGRLYSIKPTEFSNTDNIENLDNFFYGASNINTDLFDKTITFKNLKTAKNIIKDLDINPIFVDKFLNTNVVTSDHEVDVTGIIVTVRGETDLMNLRDSNDVKFDSYIKQKPTIIKYKKSSFDSSLPFRNPYTAITNNYWYFSYPKPDDTYTYDNYNITSISTLTGIGNDEMIIHVWGRIDDILSGGGYGFLEYELSDVFRWNKLNFTACRNLTKIDLTNMQVNNNKQTLFNNLFKNCYQLIDVIGLENHTINVTNMSGMFDGCQKFNKPILFDTPNVTNMSYMFRGCYLFNQTVIFDVSKVTNMSYMFSNCSEFNQSLNINTSNVTDMSYMFEKCVNFDSILNFDTSKVTTMERMFSGCSVLNIQQGFDTSNVINMSGMFSLCKLFNQTLMFDTTKVTNMSYLFDGCSTLNMTQIFDVTNVTNMSYMFRDCEQFNQELIFTGTTENVTNMSYMFRGCKVYNKPIKFVTTKVTNMSYMFADCLVFNQSINNLSTINVTNMSFMFNGCREFNQTINFNIYKVTNMESMFNICIKFNQNINLDTSNVTNMKNMFANCNIFNGTVTFSNTSKVTNMYGLFENCHKFNQPINFDTSNVTNMNYMFNKCTEFNQQISHLIVNKVQSMNYILNECTEFNQPLFTNLVNITGLLSMVRNSGINPIYCDDLLLDIEQNSIKNVISAELYVTINGKQKYDELVSIGKLAGGRTTVVQKPTIYVIDNTKPIGDLRVEEPKPTNNNLWYYYYPNDDASYSGLFSDLNSDTFDNIPSTQTRVFVYGIIDENKSYLDGDVNTSIVEININDSHKWYKLNFTKHENLVSINFNNMGDINQKQTTFGYMFSGCKNLINVNGINKHNTPVNVLNYMFSGCEKFNTNVNNMFIYSQVKYAQRFLQNCHSFNQPINIDISSMDVMEGLLQQCKNFNQTVTLNNQEISPLTNIGYMFDGCLIFNKPVNFGGLKNINITQFMFNNCMVFDSIVTLDTSKVTTFSAMFAGCYVYNKPLTLNLENARQLSHMFADCYKFNQPINATVLNVTAVNHMFRDCRELNNEIVLETSDKLTSTESTFRNCYLINQSTIAITNTTKVSNMERMFAGCKSLNNMMIDSTESVVNISYMFENCELFNHSIDNLVTTNVTNMAFMFSGCSEFNQDVSTLNTSKVVYFSGMFRECFKFNQKIDFDFSSATALNETFRNCKSLNKEVNFSTTTNKIINVSNLFRGCELYNYPIDFRHLINCKSYDYLISGALNFNNNILLNYDSVTATNNVRYIIDEVSLDPIYYDKLLEDWYVNLKPKGIMNVLQPNKSKYSSLAKQYRDGLVNELGWTLVGDSMINNPNLINRGLEVLDVIVNTNGNPQINSTYECAISDFIPVLGNTKYLLTKDELPENAPDQYFRIRYMDGGMNYISREAVLTNNHEITTASNVRFIQVSYPIKSKPKLEVGTIKTPHIEDWTPRTNIMKPSDYIRSFSNNNTVSPITIEQITNGNIKYARVTIPASSQSNVFSFYTNNKAVDNVTLSSTLMTLDFINKPIMVSMDGTFEGDINSYIRFFAYIRYVDNDGKTIENRSDIIITSASVRKGWQRLNVIIPPININPNDFADSFIIRTLFYITDENGTNKSVDPTSKCFYKNHKIEILETVNDKASIYSEWSDINSLSVVENTITDDVENID